MSHLRIQVLGPVRAWRNGLEVDLGPAAQRTVLGLLALAARHPLTRDELMSGVWSERRPPSSAVNVIQTYVKNLRHILEPDRPPRARSALLRHVGDGYALCVDEFEADILGFRTRLTAAAAALRGDDTEHAARLIEQGLMLWQGLPLSDLPLLSTHPQVLALASERYAALVRYGNLMVALGRPADGVAALEEAAAAQPLNEAWHAYLIRVYHAVGRRDRAFAVYHEVRRRLAAELGVDPGSELSDAHAILLRDEPGHSLSPRRALVRRRSVGLRRPAIRRPPGYW